MAKGKGFDPVSEANEIAEHNINPYHWFNRVNGYTLARWKTVKQLAIYTLPLYFILLAVIINDLIGEVGLWRKIVVGMKQNAAGVLGWMISLLFFVFYTVVYTVMAVQSIRERKNKAERILQPRVKERKKKLPKHRKDYGGH